jgi:ABC-type glycerol-3-phosphate transport system permease component
MSRATRIVQNLILLAFAVYALLPVYLVLIASMRSEADPFFRTTFAALASRSFQLRESVERQ